MVASGALKHIFSSVCQAYYDRRISIAAVLKNDKSAASCAYSPIAGYALAGFPLTPVLKGSAAPPAFQHQPGAKILDRHLRCDQGVPGARASEGHRARRSVRSGSINPSPRPPHYHCHYPTRPNPTPRNRSRPYRNSTAACHSETPQGSGRNRDDWQYRGSADCYP